MEAREQYTNTLSYLATCVSMLCGGTTSLFATYGSSFGEVLGFTQYETNLVASLGDYAHYMSAPLFGYLSTRMGPTRVVQAAGVLMFGGYVGLSYAFGYFSSPARDAHHYVAMMSMLFAFVGVGSKAAYMASMATTARNFKQSRHSGIALGIPLSLYGLSTFVFSTVKAGWFESDATPSRYLAFMAVVSGAVHVVASRFVRLKDDPRDAAAMAAAARRRASVSAAAAAKEMAGVGGVLDADGGAGTAQLEMVEMKETRRRRTTVSSPSINDAAMSDEDTDAAAAAGGISASTLEGNESAPFSDKALKDGGKAPARGSSDGASPAAAAGAAHGQQSAIGRFRRDPVAWALLLGLICFSGPGLAFVNNCGSMVRAMAHRTALTAEQVGRYKDRIVATQSFFSFAARLLVGYLSDVWRTRLRLPRAGLLVLAAALMVYAQGFAARISRLEDLYPLAVLVGSAMGAVFTLAPTITAETWGADNFGVCWGVITLGPAIGGHVCNLIFGSSWDDGQQHIAAAAGPGAPQDQLHCDNRCFVPAFLTTVRISYLGLLFFTAVLCLPRASLLLRRRRAD